MSIFTEINQQNKSALHNKVGKVLHNSVFSLYRIQQEYPVYKINNKYRNKKDRFDWVILDLMTVIECHGQQHIKECFFNRNKGLQYRQYKDMTKASAAVSVGYIYIEIPYTDIDIINEQYLINKYKENASCPLKL